MASATTSQKDDQDASGKSRLRKSVHSDRESLKTYVKIVIHSTQRCIRL